MSIVDTLQQFQPCRLPHKIPFASSNLQRRYTSDIKVIELFRHMSNPYAFDHFAALKVIPLSHDEDSQFIEESVSAKQKSPELATQMVAAVPVKIMAERIGL